MEKLVFLNADVYSNYGLTEDFKLIQLTFGLLHAIDLRSKQSIFQLFLNEADDDNDSNDSSDQEETASEQSQSETIDVESDSEPDHEQVIQKKKTPRNPVIIVKIGMFLHLRWLNFQATFGTITILFVPFVVTKFPLMPNM